MTSKKRMLIVEDHQLLREGLKTMISAYDDLDIVGEAEDGLEALKSVRKLVPDIVLLDLSMPRMGGISVIKEVKSLYPDMKILALTIHEAEDYVAEAFDAGADGYCIKDAARRSFESPS